MYKKVVLMLLLAFSASAQSSKPIDRANLDTTCAPCNDFFQFANGGWLKRNPVPAAYSRWGTFDELTERNEIALKQILDGAIVGRTNIGNYYAACQDSITAESRGYAPLKPYLSEIDSISSRSDLMKVFASMHKRGIPVGFRFGITPDAKNSSVWIAQALQAGLGLPDREFYIRQGFGAEMFRASYEQYVIDMLKMLDESDSSARADVARVMNIETALARSTTSRVERRDPTRVYNKLSAAQLDSLSKNWNWSAYFTALGKADIPAVTLESVPFFCCSGLADWRTSVGGLESISPLPHGSRRGKHAEQSLCGRTVPYQSKDHGREGTASAR